MTPSEYPKSSTSSKAIPIVTELLWTSRYVVLLVIKNRAFKPGLQECLMRVGERDKFVQSLRQQYVDLSHALSIIELTSRTEFVNGYFILEPTRKLF